jgi:hypothetical protein
MPVMFIVSLIIHLLQFAAIVALYLLFRRYRRRLHANEGRLRSPIETVPFADVDPGFATGPHGPTLAGEVRFIGSGDGAHGSTSDTEAWVLAVLSKRASRMFEFGTCTGRTSYLWATNSAPEARITTLTLAPDQVDQYESAPEDRAAARKRALRASTFTEFLYTGTEVEHKVEQLFGDSKALDPSPWKDGCDLIFVDGSHAYSYVKGDSEKALRMLAPGGLLVWHDYDPLSANTRGVFDHLNELRERLPLRHLQGTSLVAYRAPK